MGDVLRRPKESLCSKLQLGWSDRSRVCAIVMTKGYQKVLIYSIRGSVSPVWFLDGSWLPFASTPAVHTDFISVGNHVWSCPVSSRLWSEMFPAQLLRWQLMFRLSRRLWREVNKTELISAEGGKTLAGFTQLWAKRLVKEWKDQYEVTGWAHAHTQEVQWSQRKWQGRWRETLFCCDLWNETLELKKTSW